MWLGHIYWLVNYHFLYVVPSVAMVEALLKLEAQLEAITGQKLMMCDLIKAIKFFSLFTWINLWLVSTDWLNNYVPKIMIKLEKNIKVPILLDTRTKDFFSLNFKRRGSKKN